jgi:protein SCO1
MAASTLRTVRIGLWIAVVVVAIAATLAFVFLRVPAPGAPALGTATFGQGTYVLEDSKGDQITEASFRGAPSLLFFGYTHCPDVCPTTLAEMAAWFEALGEAGRGLRAFFITVDPERDTAAVIGDYVGWLGGRVTAVTGGRAEIDKALQAWGVVGEKVGEGDNYTMNHTASVFLINAEGGFEGTIAYGEAQSTALAKIRRLLGI